MSIRGSRSLDEKASAEIEAGLNAADDETDPSGSADQPAPRTRRQISGSDLESRFDGWVMERRERRAERTEAEKAQSLRRVLVIGLMLTVFGLLVYSSVSTDSRETAMAQQSEAISEIRSEISGVRAEIEQASSGALGEQLTQATISARAAAEGVAEAQQGFSELYYRSANAESQDNGVPDEASLQIPEHRRVLAEFFDPATFIVDGDVAYAWDSATPFETATEIDPRFAWYVRYDGVEVMDAAGYRWQVETVMPRVSRSSVRAIREVAVIWTNRDTETGVVLAWASATYEVDRDGGGVFGGLDLVITQDGADYSAEIADESEPGFNIEDLAGDEEKDE